MQIEVIDGKIIGWLPVGDLAAKTGIAASIFFSSITNGRIGDEYVLRIEGRTFLREDTPIPKIPPHGKYLNEEIVYRKLMNLAGRYPDEDECKQMLDIGAALNEALLERDGTNSEIVVIFNSLYREIHTFNKLPLAKRDYWPHKNHIFRQFLQFVG